MNLLLLAKDQMKDGARGILSSRQKTHIHSVLKLKSGDSLRAGVINGSSGQARLLNDPTEEICEIDFQPVDQAPPAALDLTYCIALPRPKAFRRLLFSLTVLGIKHFHFYHAYRVEKSYWNSPLLTPDAIQDTLVKGLEQCGDTLLPQVSLYQRFRPFVEDNLPDIARGRTGLILDKRGVQLHALQGGPACVVIGPEGGFIDFEIDLLKQQGLKSFTLGSRIFTVEIAAITFAAMTNLSGI